VHVRGVSGNWRVLVYFPSKKEVAVFFIGRHDEKRGQDVYTDMAERLGLPRSAGVRGRDRLDCCTDEGCRRRSTRCLNGSNCLPTATAEEARARCAPVVRLLVRFPAVWCGSCLPLTALPINEESACNEAPSRFLAEGEGFEPSMDEKTPITVFETAAFNHSATPPSGA
jgi:hypothetical protein